MHKVAFSLDRRIICEDLYRMTVSLHLAAYVSLEIIPPMHFEACFFLFSNSCAQRIKFGI